mmetsp:Transcript_64871/g.127370  ORF Transcript_64871/g.127370 Transcript_64871/m.127370 type:complete len:523 (-) Transcript_64871:1273-2841(-)
MQHVLRADGFRDVPKRVDRGAADRFLVRFQHLQELEADAHPLLGRHVLRSPVRDAPHQVDAVLLHLLVAILEDGREARQQVFDGGLHLGHADDVDDGLEPSDDGPEHFGVLLAQVLVQHHPQVRHQSVLAARLHHHGDAADEVCCLHAHFRRLVVQPPLDGARNLGEVRFAAHAESVHRRAEPVKHHRRLRVRVLLLERVKNPVHELLFHALVNVRGPEILDHFFNRLHDHPAVRLRLVFQVVHDPPHHLRRAHFVRQLHRRLHHLLVVLAVHCHAPHPEAAEELGEDGFLHVARLHSVRRHALLHHFQHVRLHLLVGGLELANEHHHHFSRVVVGVGRVHERNDEPDGLEERSQHFPAVLANALPQGAQHGIERLDAVRVRSLGERGEGERANGAHLLLVVDEPVLDDLHHLLQVGQHCAPHEDRDLLHDLDARVPRLPRLAALAHRLEKRQQRRDAQRRRHHGERAGSGVAHVLVEVVDVGAHGGDHAREPGGLGEVADDLAPLHARVIVLVDEQRLDHD